MKTPKGRRLLWRDFDGGGDLPIVEFVIVAADGKASYIRVENGAYTVEPGETTVERVLAQGFSAEIPAARTQLFLMIKGHVTWNAPLYDPTFFPSRR